MVVHGTTAHCERAHPQASMNPMRPLGPALASGVPAPDHGLVPLARICPADVPSQPIQPPNRLCGCDPLTFFRRYGRPRHVGLLGAQRVDGQSVVRSFVRLRVSWPGLSRTVDVWISRTTQLPVRLIISRDGHMGASPTTSGSLARRRTSPARISSSRAGSKRSAKPLNFRQAARLKTRDQTRRRLARGG